MLLLMITLPIIPYCTVLSVGKERYPFMHAVAYCRNRMGSSDGACSKVKFVLFLLVVHMNTAGTLSTWAHLACETSDEDRRN